MSRFAALATLNVNDALPDAWVDEVKVLHDYLGLAGADLASAGTITITAEYHRVTGSTQINTINDGSTQNKGQIVRLNLANGTTFGTSGNITTITGGTSTYAAGTIATFMWDGTSKWLEVGTGDPIDGAYAGASQGVLSSLFIGGGQATLGSWNGVSLDKVGGILVEAAGAGTGALQAAVNGDTVARFIALTGGGLRWGPGGGTAVDTTVDRSAAGALLVGNVLRYTKLAATYGTTVTIDARAGVYHQISVTNGTAFTIAAPTNPPGSLETQDLVIEIINSSGGAMGAVTWNAIFRPLSAGQPVNYTNPANGSRRSTHWRWNGGAWIWVGANSIDYT